MRRCQLSSIDLIHILSLNFGGDWFHHKWFIISSIAVILFGLSDQLRRVDWSLSLAIAFAGVSTLCHVFYGMDNANFRSEVLLGAGMFAAFVIILNYPIEKLRCFLPCVFIYSLVLTISSRFVSEGAIGIWGVGGVSSMNSVYMVLLGFLTLGELNKAWRYVVITAITGVAFWAQGTVAMVAACVGMGAFVLSERRSIYGAGIVLLTSVAVAIGGHYYVSNFYSSSGRMPVWEMMHQWMNTSKTWIFGNGLGSLSYIVPKLQDMTGIGPKYMYHAHSDLLQCVFELGIVGSLLFLIMGIRVAWKSWKFKQSHLMGFWAALLASMAGYMPLHMGAEAILVAIALGQVRGLYRSPNMALKS